MVNLLKNSFSSYFIIIQLKSFPSYLNFKKPEDVHTIRIGNQIINVTSLSQNSHLNIRDNSEVEQTIIRVNALIEATEIKIKGSKRKGLKDKYIKMVKTMVMGKSSQHCSVCISGFQQKQLIKKLPCRHIFHRQCAKNWLKINKTCPICRLNLEEYFEKKEQQEKTQADPEPENLKKEEQPN